MKLFKNKILWIFAGISILCVAVFSLLLLLPKKKTFPRDENVQVVFMGDSNLAFRKDDTDIPEIVASKTGATTYNCAIGGTTAVKLNEEGHFDYYCDNYCLYNLVDVILTADAQECKDNQTALNEFANNSLNKVDLLADMDFSRVDYLFLAYGLNDYTLGKKIDNEENRYDVTSYCGSMRTAIEKLQKAYPNLKIVLCSITFCYTDDQEQGFMSGYDYSYGGGTIGEYRDALRNVSDEYENVYFLDNLDLLGINENNYQEYLVDNMHVNSKGQQLWAQNAADLILQLEAAQ